MIITKTPLRISFFGGGTDYPAWTREHGGAVLSTSINKYSYLHVRRLPPFFPYKSKVVWSHIEEVNAIDEIAHPSVRETLRFMNFHDGISAHYNGDVPAQSGLGSSSSFTVGFLHALYGLNGVIPDKKRLAEEAIHIEQNCIKENVGSQDQIASALGGFNKIIFHTDGSFTATPINLPPDKTKTFEKHLMLFFTGLTRRASDVVVEQIKNMPQKKDELHRMRAMVDQAVDMLEQHTGDWLGNFGRLLHVNWQIKRSLSSKISTSAIDDYYARARNAGAMGGKLLGAGGGGFLLIYARPEDQRNIRTALSDLLYVDFALENEGSKIIYQMA